MFYLSDEDGVGANEPVEDRIYHPRLEDDDNSSSVEEAPPRKEIVRKRPASPAMEDRVLDDQEAYRLLPEMFEAANVPPPPPDEQQDSFGSGCWNFNDDYDDDDVMEMDVDKPTSVIVSPPIVFRPPPLRRSARMAPVRSSQSRRVRYSEPDVAWIDPPITRRRSRRRVRSPSPPPMIDVVSPPPVIDLVSVSSSSSSSSGKDAPDVAPRRIIEISSSSSSSSEEENQKQDEEVLEDEKGEEEEVPDDMDDDDDDDDDNDQDLQLDQVTPEHPILIDQLAVDEEPTPAKLQLYEFQKEGVARIVDGWLNKQYVAKEPRANEAKTQIEPRFYLERTRCFLLYDEMGLGKTLQALSAVLRLENRTQPTLIVVPPNAMREWTAAIARYFADQFEYVAFAKNRLTCKSLKNLGPRHLVSTSYAVLANAFKFYMMDNYEELSNTDLLRLVKIYGHSTTELPHVDDRRATLLTWAKEVLSGILRSNQMSRNKAYSRFMTMEWDVAIFDEIQNCKTTSAIASRAAAFLKASYRLCLSGTPIMNSGREMLSVIKNGLGLMDVDWTAIEQNPNGPYTHALLKMISFGRPNTLPEIVHLIPQRHPEEECVLLDWPPEPQLIELYCSTRDASVRALREVTETNGRRPEESVRDYTSRKQQQRMNAVTLIQRLKVICLHPSVIPIQEQGTSFSWDAGWPAWSPFAHTRYYPEWFRKKTRAFLMAVHRICPRLPQDVRLRLCRYFAQAERYAIQPSPKMLYFLDLYRQMERTHPTNKKMICVSSSRTFCQHVFGAWLDQIGIKWALLAGGEKGDQDKALKRFRDDPECTVLVMVKGAGATGLNLQYAAHLILFDLHWNEALDEQAIHRIVRLGQTQRVVIRKLFMRHSVDMVMGALQDRKAIVTDAWLARNDKKLNLQQIGVYLREQDGVGRTLSDPPRKAEVLVKLEAKINEVQQPPQEIGAAAVVPKSARDNLVNSRETDYWLAPVGVPGTLCGNPDQEVVVASRQEIADRIIAALPENDPGRFPLNSWNGRSIPFAVYQVLSGSDFVKMKNVQPTTPHVILQLKGDGNYDFEKYRERIEAGTSRILDGACFGGVFADSTVSPPLNLGRVWVESPSGEVYGQFSRTGKISRHPGLGLYYLNNPIRLFDNDEICFDNYTCTIMVQFWNLVSPPPALPMDEPEPEPEPELESLIVPFPEPLVEELSIEALASEYIGDVDAFYAFFERRKSAAQKPEEVHGIMTHMRNACSLKTLLLTPSKDLLVSLQDIKEACEKMRLFVARSKTHPNGDGGAGEKTQ